MAMMFRCSCSKDNSLVSNFRRRVSRQYHHAQNKLSIRLLEVLGGGRSWPLRRWVPQHQHRAEYVPLPLRRTPLLTVAVVPMLGYLYREDEKNKIPTLSADIIKASLSLGMVLGQIGCEFLLS